MFIKQKQFASGHINDKLRSLGFKHENKNGFQIHELINLIPEKVIFKKTFHSKDNIFMDWKKNTEFYPKIYSFHGTDWLYDLVKLPFLQTPQKYDNGASRKQLVDLLGELIIYIETQYNFTNRTILK